MPFLCSLPVLDKHEGNDTGSGFWSLISILHSIGLFSYLKGQKSTVNGRKGKGQVNHSQQCEWESEERISNINACFSQHFLVFRALMWTLKSSCGVSICSSLIGTSLPPKTYINFSSEMLLHIK